MANTRQLIPNKLAIEQVSGSPYWRMRYKVQDKWKGRSTKKADEEEAEQFARQQFAELEVLKKHGIHTEIAHTVSDASKIYYQRLVDDLAKGTGKPTYESYKSVITKYIDPIAGKWDIRSVSNSKMLEYFAGCETVLGRQQAKGSINTHNIVWRQIFRIALDRRWIKHEDIPELTTKDKGRDGESRPAFSLNEYMQFRRFLRTYHESADRFSSRYRRQLLREYCIFLFASGMRPGREVLGLRWKHIQFAEGASAVAILNPEGKTGDRPTVPMNFIKPSLRRLQALTKRTDLDDYVFATPDGQRAKGMSHLVSRALTDAGLRFDALGQARTAYSFRHTYATLLRVYRDFTFDELAENMGNSVQMIERHYYKAKPTDRAERYATGKKRQSRSEKKVEAIYDLLMEKFTPEIVAFLINAMSEEQFENEVLFVQAFEIELRNWSEQTADEGEAATEQNLRYVFQAAQNRADEFLHGESIW